MTTTPTDTPAPTPGRAAARAPRSPVDLLIGIAGLFLVFVVLLLVSDAIADGAPTDDASQLRAVIPSWLLFAVALGANLLLIVLFVYVVLRSLFVAELRELTRAIVAAVAAYAMTSYVNSVLENATYSAAPLPGLPDDVLTAATLGYVAAGIAFARTMPTGQPRVRSLLWGTNAAIAVTSVMAGVTSILAVLFTILVGLTCAALSRYAVGTSVPPPATGRIHAELHRFDLTADRITPAGTDRGGDALYLADLADGRQIELCVLNSENTSGFWLRLRDLLLLRGPVAPRMLYGARRRAEHAALMSAAAREAGVDAPRVLALGELTPGRILLARERSRVRGLDTLEPERISDSLLDDLWRQLGLLHQRRVAHGDLNGTTVGVLDQNTEARPPVTAALTGVDRGAVAAPQIRTALDTAAMVTLLALHVGADRAVSSAVRALGVSATAAILPMLQPAGLPHALRAALRRADRSLMGDLRRHIAAVSPEAPTEPARLERMRPRTIVSFVVVTLVGLVLVYQLSGVELGTIRYADPGWTLAALVMATTCMVAAAMVLIGFVPAPLPWWRTVLVQYAASFVRIAAPAGLGSIAINSRYVIKAGVPTSLSLSAVGLTQLVGFLVHVPLLLVCAYLTGTSYWTGFSPSPTVTVIAIVATVSVGTVLLHPRLRRAVGSRLRPYLTGTLPQLLDLFQRPASLVLGVGGTLLLTVAFVLCLHFSVLAFAGPGLEVSLVAVAVVFLAGNAIGSAAPTPGGLGAVEAALIGGLTTLTAMPADVALPAVLLFRVLTFWFPVLPGWAAFSYLQRREAI
ncbi:lysylphosphatidylglycerol synthase transmembrane domain-containing protein [Nocardiopsis sp. B62]|uniref:lysylphosphatidylglycerol synthase transmembrane domain-containing protein n=1 Tax=Nocardiopsis sp. B62 TaxID=2824874 RepID=UPI001B35FABC|nr:lysylphosphatidylglycerol synthase transmembrane domain-containing protein [Nocardiopsis sp. B62]MBQ1081958.1 flippase-like domain-containing protein [Nocardiopsis sp. B62]